MPRCHAPCSSSHGIVCLMHRHAELGIDLGGILRKTRIILLARTSSPLVEDLDLGGALLCIFVLAGLHLLVRSFQRSLNVNRLQGLSCCIPVRGPGPGRSFCAVLFCWPASAGSQLPAAITSAWPAVWCVTVEDLDCATSGRCLQSTVWCEANLFRGCVSNTTLSSDSWLRGGGGLAGSTV
jgi:hypothetical protein